MSERKAAFVCTEPGKEGCERFTDPSVAMGAEIKIGHPIHNEAIYCFDDGCIFHASPKFCVKMVGGIYEVTMRFIVGYGGVAIAYCQSREEGEAGKE